MICQIMLIDKRDRCLGSAWQSIFGVSKEYSTASLQKSIGSVSMFRKQILMDPAQDADSLPALNHAGRP